MTSVKINISKWIKKNYYFEGSVKLAVNL